MTMDIIRLIYLILFVISGILVSLYLTLKRISDSNRIGDYESSYDDFCTRPVKYNIKADDLTLEEFNLYVGSISRDYGWK